jgi:uncharacterized protein with PQ loop repeat
LIYFRVCLTIDISNIKMKKNMNRLQNLSSVSLLLFIMIFIGLASYLIYTIIKLYRKDTTNKQNSTTEMIEDLYLRKNKIIDFIWKSIK